MAPFITIFVDKKSTPEQTEIAKTLEQYYVCFIDSENQTYEIKRKYQGSNHRFFGMDCGKWLMYTIDVVEVIPPAFVLTFDVDQTIKKTEWKLALDFVKTIFSDAPDQKIIDEFKILVPEATKVEKLTVAPAKDAVKQNNEYMFSHHIDKEKDLCFCQVEKPFTDKPYTCVIENFSKEDFVPMFTAYYVCQSWGVCSKDHVFLVHLWKYLEMSKKYGNLDLSDRLQKNIEECKNGKPEPRVYRMEIKDVLKLFEEKELAIKQKEETVQQLMDQVE